MMKAGIAFAHLALHAKMHKQLDYLPSRVDQDVERIEKAQILAAGNDGEYAKLENLKREILSIRFV
jgi:hypothetical protein